MRLGFLLGFAPAAALGIGASLTRSCCPAMQVALGLSFVQAGVLGSANTAGYLFGCARQSPGAVRDRLPARALRFAVAASVEFGAVGFRREFLPPPRLRFVQGLLGAFVFRRRGGAAAGERRAGFGDRDVLRRRRHRHFAVAARAAAHDDLANGLAAPAALSVLLSLVAYLAYGGLTEPAARVVGGDGSLRPIVPLLVLTDFTRWLYRLHDLCDDRLDGVHYSLLGSARFGARR